MTVTGAGVIYAGGSLDGVCKVVGYQGEAALASVTGEGPKQEITGMAHCGTDVLTLSMDGSLNVAQTADPTAAAYTTKVGGLALPTQGLAAAGDVVVCAAGQTVTLHRQSAGYGILHQLEGLDYAPLAVAVNVDGTEVAVSSVEERGKARKVSLYKVVYL